MGVRVYYSEISAHKEVKKRQQKVMMILESKHIPYEAIDITEPGKESDKDFMLTNAKPKGDSKAVLSPQVFNGEVYCGDYEDFELANENDELEKFLNVEKISNNVPATNGNQNGVNGSASREGSAEAEVAKVEQSNVTGIAPPPVTSDNNDNPAEEEEPMSTTEPAPVTNSSSQPEKDGLNDDQPAEEQAEEEEEQDE